MASTAVFLCLLILLRTARVESLIDCDNVLSSDDTFTGLCNNKWHNLKPLIHPTQKEVGFAWVQKKLNDDFDTEETAQNTIDDSIVPAVLGPADMIYIVDHHHTLAALDFSGFDDVSVTVNILCDKRQQQQSEVDFWDDLAQQNLAYLAAHPEGQPNALPVAINYTSIPSTFSFTADGATVFTDDPWRALASFSRKVETAPAPALTCTDIDDKRCERCMFRGCSNGYDTTGSGVPFFEFRWAYFMNDATYFNIQYWPSTDALEAFKSLYQDLSTATTNTTTTIADITTTTSTTAAAAAAALRSSDSTSNWETAAAYLVPLCRSSFTVNYQLPATLFPSVDFSSATSTTAATFTASITTAAATESMSLPGYVNNYLKLADDPDCSSPICK